MLNKDTFQIIQDTIEMMTIENNGELELLPNLEDIARRAEVSTDSIREYILEIILGDD